MPPKGQMQKDAPLSEDSNLTSVEDNLKTSFLAQMQNIIVYLSQVTNLKVWDAGQVAEGEWQEIKRTRKAGFGSGWLGLWAPGLWMYFEKMMLILEDCALPDSH
ncbi:hypothetical protein D1P53_005608 [Cryptococcus gattii VGV]|nr:hypothetical protein D1P53_005608 [Cryptococcus gattii VGV]